METSTLQRILKSGMMSTVLDVPVGLNIYLFNPFRICSMSPDGNWKDTGAKLISEYNRFLAFAGIGHLEKEPIGDGKNILLNKDFKAELEVIKSNIDKPVYRLVWKIFWLNHMHDDYDKLAKNLEDIPADGFSDHSLAVLYHYRAIQNTIGLVDNCDSDFNPHLWDKSLDYWNKAINSDVFTNEIKKIIEDESKSGYKGFIDFDMDAFKNEIIHAIFCSAVNVPLQLLEQGFDETRTNEIAKKNECFSRFLGIILRTSLGNEKIRYEYAKILTSSRISKDVNRSFRDLSFKMWADNGNYRKLYDTGMQYIDLIHDVTECIREESHDKNIHTSTFLSRVPDIPEIHDRVVMTLVESILSQGIVLNQSLSSDVKDRTMYTQLILGLRILAECNIDRLTALKVAKETEGISKRYSFIKLDSKGIQKLNGVNRAMAEIHNPDYADKYYLASYCYFIDGEYADPDASIIKSVESTRGTITFTRWTIIPRSKLAKQYHDNKISRDDLSLQIRYLKQGDFKLKRAEFQHELDIIQNNIGNKNKELEPVYTLMDKTKEALGKALQQIQKKINLRKDELLKAVDFSDIKKEQQELKEKKGDLKDDLADADARINEFHDFAYNDLGNHKTRTAIVWVLAGIFAIIHALVVQKFGAIFSIFLYSLGVYTLIAILTGIVIGVLMIAKSPLQSKYDNIDVKLKKLDGKIKETEKQKLKEATKEFEKDTKTITEKCDAEIRKLEDSIKADVDELKRMKEAEAKLKEKMSHIGKYDIRKASEENHHPVMQYL